MTEMKCPNCDAVIDEDDLFCGECGSRLDQAKPEAKAEEPAALLEGDAEAPDKLEPGPLEDNQHDTVMHEDREGHLGLWVFAGGGGTVEFAGDGTARFLLENEPDWSATGRWERIGDALIFDCAGFTFYELNRRGPLWIGCHYRPQDEEDSTRYKSILSRPGEDIHQYHLSATEALRPREDGSYEDGLYAAFLAYVTMDEEELIDCCEDCKRKFSSLIDMQPDRPEAYVGRGFSSYLLDEYEEAISDFDNALERDFGVDARHESIWLSLETGDGSEDRDLHEFDLPTMLFFKAESCYSISRIDEAELLLDGNFDAIPDQYEGEKWLLRASILTEKEAWSEAWRALNQCLQIEPKMAHAHYLRGVLHIHSGSEETAIEALSFALDLDPDLEDALFHRARLHAASENWAAYGADIEQLEEQMEHRADDEEFLATLEELKQLRSS